jgi:hypothetical protein
MAEFWFLTFYGYPGPMIKIPERVLFLFLNSFSRRDSSGCASDRRDVYTRQMGGEMYSYCKNKFAQQRITVLDHITGSVNTLE